MGVAPKVTITADGQDVTAAIKARLISLSLLDCAGEESDTLSIELDNADEQLEPPAEGRLLEVFIGYDDQVTSMGQFVVDEVSAQGPPSTVKVQARSTPFDPDSQFGMMQTKKRRSFELTTVGELVAKVASDSGLTPSVATSLASVNLGHVDQADESDIHMLSRIAADLGAIVKPAYGRLLFIPAASGETASGEQIPTIAIKRTDAESYGFNKCRREALGSVVACYRDSAGGLDVEVTEGTGEPIERLRFHYPSQSAAQAAAKGRLTEARRGSGTLTLRVAGNPDLQAESKIELTGFPLAIDGIWTVKKATHDLSPDGGYTTTVEAESDIDVGAGASSDANGGGSLDAGGLDPVPPLTPSVP